MNTELFKKIHDVIRVEPDKLDMHTWENPSSDCGTTRCIAGHAIAETTGFPVFDYFGRFSPETVDLADSLGVDVHVPSIADALLGLDGDGGLVFYLRDHEAAKFVRLAALGLDDQALEYLDEVAE